MTNALPIRPFSGHVLTEDKVLRRTDDRDFDTLAEDYANELLDAIHAGAQLSCHYAQAEDGSPTDPETCVTRFTDPRTGETRFALEVWSRSTKQTYDYATEALAMGAQTREDNKLGLV